MAGGPQPPPGPSGLPLLGNTVPFVRSQGRYVEGLVNEYGPVVSVDIVGLGEVTVIADPELVDTVLRSGFYRKATIGRELLADLLGDGLLLAEGEDWQRKRRLVQPSFDPDRLDTYGVQMVDRALELVADLEPGRPYDIGDLMRRATFEILLDTLFGKEIDYERSDLQDSFRTILAPGRPRNQPLAYVVPKWVPIPMWYRYNRAIGHFESFLRDLVEDAQEGTGAGDDLLTRLVNASDAGDHLSDAELRDELMTMLFAGHETTATALTFTLHLLGTHPDVESRLVAELDSVIGDARPTVDDLPELAFTECVLREAMRLYPPVPAVAREPTTEVTLGGYRLSPGTTVAASQWVIHRDSAHYDSPQEFDPSRWQRTPLSNRHRFAFFPFGGGPRRCVGEHFAMMEAQLVLATLVQAYKFELIDAEPLTPSVSIVTKPTQEVTAVPRPRSV